MRSDIVTTNQYRQKLKKYVIDNNERKSSAKKSEVDQIEELFSVQNIPISDVEGEEAGSEEDQFAELLSVQNTRVLDMEEAEGECEEDQFAELLDIQNTSIPNMEEAEAENESDQKKVLCEVQQAVICENQKDIHKTETSCQSADLPGTNNLVTGKNKEKEIFFDIAIDVIERFKLCRLIEDDTDTIWRYNGRCYEPISEKRVRSLIYKTFTIQFKRDNNTIKVVINSVLEFVKQEIRVNPKFNRNFTEEDFEKTKNYIVFKNYIYDLLNDKALEFSEDLACWLSVDANYVFPGDEEEFPESYQLLKSRAMNGDAQSMAMLDYTTAVLFMNRTVKHFFVAGNASNSGKSVYFSFVDRLMPSGRVMHFEPEDLSDKFGLDEIDTTALISCADVQTKEFDAKSISILKRLTGDAYVRAKRKHRGALEEHVFTKILFGTNGGFTLSNYDEGIWNRLVVLPFVNSVSESDRDEMLLTKLLQDKDQIISLCAKKLGNILYRDGSLTFPESNMSLTMKKSWLLKENFVESFFSACIVITGNIKDCVSKDSLYLAYTEFFDIEAEKSDSKNLQRVKKNELEKMLITFSKGKIFHDRDRTDEFGVVRPHPVFRIRGCKLVTFDR